MTKTEFLSQLEKGLSGLPKDDIGERISFFSEMIDDRVEEGMTEEDAIAQIGSVDDVVSQIIAETPLKKIVKERIKPKRRLSTWEIVLISLGSPIWLSLIIVAFAVVISLYASLWSIIVSLWAAFGAVVAGGFGGLIGGIAIAIFEQPLSGIAVIGASVVCLGLSILLFFACKILTIPSAKLTKKIALLIKTCFIRKEKIK
jgi:uncharacterized membrane protein